MGMRLLATEIVALTYVEMLDLAGRINRALSYGPETTQVAETLLKVAQDIIAETTVPRTSEDFNNRNCD